MVSAMPSGSEAIATTAGDRPQPAIIVIGISHMPAVTSAALVVAGVGWLIDPQRDGGITRSEAMMLLDHDIDRVIVGLYQRLPWVASLDEVRVIVLANMAFNLGLQGLLQFTRTLAAIQAGIDGLPAEFAAS